MCGLGISKMGIAHISAEEQGSADVTAVLAVPLVRTALIKLEEQSRLLQLYYF